MLTILNKTYPNGLKTSSSGGDMGRLENALAFTTSNPEVCSGNGGVVGGVGGECGALGDDGAVTGEWSPGRAV